MQSAEKEQYPLVPKMRIVGKERRTLQPWITFWLFDPDTSDCLG